MNKDIKARWVEALRSGEYVQGRYQLRHAGRYCCLGVLCDLAEKDGAFDWSGRNTSTATLPMSVVRWAGLKGDVIRIPRGGDLAVLNDNGTPFDEIAGLIEEHL